jgi:hypothetical protein
MDSVSVLSVNGVYRHQQEKKVWKLLSFSEKYINYKKNQLVYGLLNYYIQQWMI